MTYVITLILIIFSALFSGLTLGLMGLDVQTLKRKMELGDKQAKKIHTVRKHGNQLLTTLLLGNVAVNSVLAIFLGSIATGVAAGFIATALIFVFGEIIPQAVISRHAMKFGAKTAGLVRFLMFVLAPICLPIAWALDKLLGHEVPTVFSRHELVRVIEEHEDSAASDLDEDEERILKGALSFSQKKVSQVMTPNTVVSMLAVTDTLTAACLKKLKSSGHSRFPVYDGTKDNIIGMVHLRDLLGATAKQTVADVYSEDIHMVDVSTPLDEVLNSFLKLRTHLFIARDEFGGFEGVITVEDILEEIVGREIVDESDKHVDLRKVARERSKKKRKKKSVK